MKEKYKKTISPTHIVPTIIDNFYGAEFSLIHRACNMVMLTFTAKNGEEYQLHVQCHFRITLGDKVLLDTDALYTKSTKIQNEENVEYDIIGNTLFDEIVDKKSDLFLAGKVEEIRYDEGDLRLVLNSGIKIDVFKNVTEYENEVYPAYPRENYRIFRVCEDLEDSDLVV